MRGSQLTSGLHMRLEVPEHAYTDMRDVDDVGAQGNGGLGVFAIDAFGRQGLDEAGQVFVQRKQAQQLRRRLSIGLGLAVGGLGRLLIVVDGFGVEVADLKDVDGDAPTEAKDGPSASRIMRR